jgi:hypothetical protein
VWVIITRAPAIGRLRLEAGDAPTALAHYEAAAARLRAPGEGGGGGTLAEEVRAAIARTSHRASLGGGRVMARTPACDGHRFSGTALLIIVLASANQPHGVESVVMAAGRWQEPEEGTVLQFRAAALARIAGREADAEAALREAAAREGASADTWVGLAAGREASCHLGLSI